MGLLIIILGVLVYWMLIQTCLADEALWCYRGGIVDAWRGIDVKAIGLDVGGLLDIYTIDSVAHESSVPAGPLVVNACRITGESLQMEVYIIYIYMSHFVGSVATDETPILARCCDVVEIDSAHLAASSHRLALGEAPVGILVVAIGPWIGSDIDGFGLSPPYIRPQLALQDDV